MANIYVKSGASGAANGTSWTDAYVTLGAAITAAAAGDSIWVSNNHSETTASPTYSIAGTVGNPTFITCVLDTGSAPFAESARRATASVSCSSNGTLTINGYADIYGIHPFGHQLPHNADRRDNAICERSTKHRCP